MLLYLSALYVWVFRKHWNVMEIMILFFQGYIDKEEIMTTFEKLGVNIDSCEAERLLKRYVLSNDGIDFVNSFPGRF